METSRSTARIAAVMCGTAALLLPMGITGANTSAEVTLTQTVEQITTDPGDEYDPSISGDLVVYTGNRDGDTDVYYVDLTTGVEIAVTQLPGMQELSDVYSPLITYTDMTVRDVWVYDTRTGDAVNVTASPGAYSSNPAIGRDALVWEDVRDANVELYGMDLSSGIERRITQSQASDATPEVSTGTDHDQVVWQVCTAGICDIGLYDWSTGVMRMITESTDADDRRPDMDGDVVVYESYKDQERDIYAYDVTTGETRRLALPGSQNNPSISGDVVSFDDVSTGTYRIMLWHLPTGAVLQLTNGTEGEFLNDIDGDRVAYTALRNGQLDIYVATFTIHVSGDYDFTGFFPPVNNDSVLNVVNAGRSIPVKFGLGGDKGLQVLAADSPTSHQVTCDQGLLTDPIETTVTAGASTLTYDPSTEQYTYIWKTDSTWKGCRQFTMTLDNGIQHTALFKFR
jgi:beta propeller repeat protein